MMPGKKRTAKPLGQHFLREWRLWKNDLSQAEVGAAIGMTQGGYQKIESSENPYSEIVLDALARFYGCSQGDLLSRNPLKGGETAIDWTSAGKRLEIIRRALSPDLASYLIVDDGDWFSTINSYGGDVPSGAAIRIHAATGLPIRFIISGATDELSKEQMESLLSAALNSRPD
jgi:transcriptional regulator with XRE-family HTH domain